jgi:hypothetical protein
MADFCNQCSYEMFGPGFNDLAGLTSEEGWRQGLAVAVICEGCGPIQVDPLGNCASHGCLLKHTEVTWNGQD